MPKSIFDVFYNKNKRKTKTRKKVKTGKAMSYLSSKETKRSALDAASDIKNDREMIEGLIPPKKRKRKKY